MQRMFFTRFSAGGGVAILLCVVLTNFLAGCGSSAKPEVAETKKFRPVDASDEPTPAAMPAREITEGPVSIKQSGAASIDINEPQAAAGTNRSVVRNEAATPAP